MSHSQQEPGPIRTRQCEYCEETYPAERIRYGTGGDPIWCDDPYCIELRATTMAVNFLVLATTFVPILLAAVAVAVASFYFIHALWLFIPLAIWTFRQCRRVPDRLRQQVEHMPQETRERLGKLHLARGIRRELWRAEYTITRSIEEHLSGLRDSADLNPRDKEAVHTATIAHMKRSASTDESARARRGSNGTNSHDTKTA